MENKIPNNKNYQKAEVAMLSSVKIDFRVKSFIMLLVVYIEGGREWERREWERNVKESGFGSSRIYKAGWQARDPGKSWCSLGSEGSLKAEFLFSWGICLFS